MAESVTRSDTTNNCLSDIQKLCSKQLPVAVKNVLMFKESIILNGNICLSKRNYCIK